MNSSMLKIMNLKPKWAVIGLAVLCIIAIALAVTIWVPLNQRRVVRSADSWMNDAYEGYYLRSFGEVTNTLSAYIQFLEAHKKPLSRYKDVDRLIYLAHIHLAYMLVYSGNESAACHHLNLAYELHKRLRAKAGLRAVPRQDFVEFVITGIEKVDAKRTNVAWKSEFPLNTNFVEKVKMLFAADQ